MLDGPEEVMVMHGHDVGQLHHLRLPQLLLHTLLLLDGPDEVMVKHGDTFPNRIHTLLAEHIGIINNKLFRFVGDCRVLLVAVFSQQRRSTSREMGYFVVTAQLCVQ